MDTFPTDAVIGGDPAPENGGNGQTFRMNSLGQAGNGPDLLPARGFDFDLISLRDPLTSPGRRVHPDGEDLGITVGQLHEPRVLAGDGKSQERHFVVDHEKVVLRRALCLGRAGTPLRQWNIV